MLTTVLLFDIFYLIFANNYFNDNFWFLGLNQGWPVGICQSNQYQSSLLMTSPTYIEYTCNDDGSVTRSRYAGINADGECIAIQNTINYTTNFNPNDVYGFECDSTNKYAELNFFGHLFSDPQSNQCSSAVATATFKWSVDSCASDGKYSNM